MAFDPYYAWLGIRDPRRPPHHYRLLGLEPFETDIEVIAGAAERQMSHVRSFQNSPEAFFCAGVLNDLQAARLTLLDPTRKAAYDQQLRNEVAAVPQAPARAAAPSTVHPSLAAAPATSPQPGTAAQPGLAAYRQPTTPQTPQQATPAPRPLGPDEEPELAELRIKLPIGVVIFSVGVLAMALYAGARMMLDSQARQAKEAAALAAAAAAAQNTLPTPLTTSPGEPAKKVETTAAPVNLPPAAAASPSDSRVQALRGHTAPCLGAEFSADGRLAVSAAEDKTLRWWNLATGQQVGMIDRHGDVVTGAAFSRDGRTAITSSLDKTVRIWDLDAKSQLHRLRHNAAVNCLTLSADGQLILSGSADGVVRAWSVKEGQLEKTMTGHTGPVTSLAIAGDGRRAASGGGDAQVCLWDLEGGADPTLTVETVDRVTAVALSPNGEELLWGGASGILVRVSAATGEELDTLYGHTGRIRGVAFVDDYRVASASEDGTLRLWSRTTGEELDRFALAGAGLRSLSVSATGDHLLTAASDSAVHLWKIQPLPTLEPERLIVNLPREEVEEAGQIRNVKAHAGPVLDVAFSPNGRRFATAGADGLVRLFDTEEKPAADKPPEKPATAPPADPAKAADPNKPDPAAAPAAAVDRIVIGSQPVRSVQFSPDGTLILAAGGEPGRVGLWNAITGQLVRTFASHQDSTVTHARFVQFPDAPLSVLSSDVDRAVFTWDAANAAERGRLIAAAFGDRWAFCPTTGVPYSAGYDGTLRAWMFDLGRDTVRLSLPTDVWTERLAITRDGQLAIAAGSDRVLHVFSLGAATERMRLRGHTGRIAAVTISADGKRAIAGGTDLRLWDLESGKTAYEFPGQPDPVESATFSPNGKLALTGDRSGGVRLWRLPLPEPLEADKTAFVSRAVKARIAPPAAEELDPAVKDVKIEYLSNPAGLTAADKSALAGQIIVAGMAEEANAARRFALLSTGRDVAAQAGDMIVAEEAIAALAGEFDLDVETLRGEAIVTAAKAARTDNALTLATSAVLGADRALSRFDFDLAAKLLGVVPTLARKAGGPPLASLGAQRVQRLKALKGLFDKQTLSEALGQLERDPADADHNLAVGRFLAEHLGAWQRALPRLALASDAKWRNAAQTALTEPTTSAAQLDLAKAFAALGSAAKSAGDRAAAQELFGQAYTWGARAITSAADDAGRTAAAEAVRPWLAELAAAKSLSLAQLPPESVAVGPGAPGTGSIGVGGLLGYESDGVGLAIFKGALAADSISMHPGATGTARVRYRLGKQYGQFRAVCAIADTAAKAPLAAPVVFRVTADGQEVFRSDNLEAAGESQEFVVDLSGADVIELSVSVNGSNLGAHALWLEPKLQKK